MIDGAGVSVVESVERDEIDDVVGCAMTVGRDSSDDGNFWLHSNCPLRHRLIAVYMYICDLLYMATTSSLINNHASLLS